MALREKTGLPMMECKKSLQECGGNTDQAVEWLRKQGIKTQALRADRETTTGRLAVYTDLAKGVGAMIELKCESAPVANSPDFKDLCNDVAKTLALGPGATTADELLAQKSTAHPDKTLGDLKNDLFNRMREVFELSRILRINAPCGGYAHHDGSKAALVEVAGNVTGADAAEAAKGVAMHVVALAPQAVSKEELDPAVVDKEREILSEAARKEGRRHANQIHDADALVVQGRGPGHEALRHIEEVGLRSAVLAGVHLVSRKVGRHGLALSCLRATSCRR
jgi:elongation factor Ts